jgi:hypothetical protein
MVSISHGCMAPNNSIESRIPSLREGHEQTSLKKPLLDSICAGSVSMELAGNGAASEIEVFRTAHQRSKAHTKCIFQIFAELIFWMVRITNQTMLRTSK